MVLHVKSLATTQCLSLSLLLSLSFQPCEYSGFTISHNDVSKIVPSTINSDVPIVYTHGEGYTEKLRDIKIILTLSKRFLLSISKSFLVIVSYLKMIRGKSEIVDREGQRLHFQINLIDGLINFTVIWQMLISSDRQRNKNGKSFRSLKTFRF